MSVFMGDFLGFSLGEEHSYGINITRVSTNDRYIDNLLPDFSDSTAQVPGGDGTYYWNTQYNSRVITMDFAFDDLRDEDLRKLRQMFSYRTVKPLILDEFPYKKYMVKCQSPPQFRYVCFDQQEFRVYKGEGSVNLIAYYPFAFGVLSPNVSYKQAGGEINNMGDMPANLIVEYSIDNLSSGNSLSLEDLEGNVLGSLVLSGVSPQGEDDEYIQINGRTQLIEGLDSNHIKTGNLYNKFISSGDFIFPPVGRTFLKSTTSFEQASYTPLFF